MKVLRRLGVEQLVVDTGIKAELLCQSGLGHRRDACTGSISTPSSEARFGGPYANIHRGDLHAVLEKGVAPARSRSIIVWSRSRDRRDAIRLVFDERRGGRTPISSSAPTA